MNKKPPIHIADLDESERKARAVELGIPAFRADQVSRQWFSRLSDDAQEWTDLPESERDQIKQKLTPDLITKLKELSTDQGETVKTLWKLYDEKLVESVLMQYPNRTTVCISSQVGCGMACPFCATGQGGLKRNLSAAEIVAQVQASARFADRGFLPNKEARLSNIVFMGMGEPLANFNAVVTAIKRITQPAPAGLGISARNITVSTVGLIPKIYELAEVGLPLRLALSLHAPDDELRNELVPLNKKYPISEVLKAVWDYSDTVKRRVSIEYALIKDINDQKHRAALLAKRLKGRAVHVNLIPLNPTPGSKWTAASEKAQSEFVETLENAAIAVTVRDTRGSDIDGACGQLAAKMTDAG
jgi:23S rRNA (adenine2503-C2)-methyltransferase